PEDAKLFQQQALSQFGIPAQRLEPQPFRFAPPWRLGDPVVDHKAKARAEILEGAEQANPIDNRFLSAASACLEKRQQERAEVQATLPVTQADVQQEPFEKDAA